MWPGWTIRHVVSIRTRLAAGESLDEIGGTLGDWQAEAKKWVRTRYSFKEAHERMLRREAVDRFAESISDTVYFYLRDIGIERPGRIDDKIARAVSKDRFVDDVLDLLRRGCNPVLVVTSKEIAVSPDFALSPALGNAEYGNQPVLVVPIRDAFIEAFSKTEPDLPKVAKLMPAMHLAERGGQKKLIRKYRLDENWKFTLENEKSSAPSTGGNPRGLRRQHSRRRS
jgi:hypothetical protein